jgi:acyl-[acyl carrier protein]--UDP-N-acetylglucosamine O-acyltransferase
MEVGCSFVSSDVVLFVLANNTRQTTDQCLNNLCCSRNKASSSSVREQRKQMDIAAQRQQPLIDKQSYSSNHGSHDLPDASAVLF